MKTKNVKILLLVCYVCSVAGFISCGGEDYPSFEEKKRDERKIVDRIIAEKNIEVLKNFPANGVFKDNQFVELSNGVFLNVVDSGNGQRAVANVTTLLVRASGEYFYSPDSLETFDTFVNTDYPMEFKYGSAYNVVQAHSVAYDSYYYLFGMAFEDVLQYVGDSAVIKMIVPAYAEVNNFGLCSTFQSSSDPYRYIPIYFDRVKYIFY
ncbi:MAG: DUF4827 domain-containing protein [Tannerella sp.]|jgi:hypothetical protein|nr:DUF4827 domain-containing protein [Tannerella sp.]